LTRQKANPSNFPFKCTFPDPPEDKECLSILQEKLPRRIFWGHTEIFIIDSKLAREGIRSYIDLMLRHPQIRESAYIFISDKKAKKMLELTPSLERSTSEVLRELAKSKIGVEVTLKDLNQSLSGDAKAISLPWIKELPPDQRSEGKKTIPYITGTAVFKKDKMIGHINDRLTRGVLWVRNEIESYMDTVTLEEAEGYISMRLLRGHSKLLPKIENGEWKITLKVDTEDDIVQNGTNLNLMNPKFTRMLEKDLEATVQETVQAALNQVQKKMNADIFGFADAFHRKYPKQWHKAKDHWDEIFPKVKVSIEVKAYLRRPGMITAPGGFKEEEVRKK
jgi:spore germination protein KC